MSEEKQYAGYGVTANTEKASDSEIKSLEPGIHEDVEFKGAFFEKLKDDSEAPSLFFVVEKDGAQIRDVLFAVDIERVKENYEKYPPEPAKRANPALELKKGDIPTLAQKIGMKFQMFNTRLNEYMDNLITDDEAKLTGILDSYEAIAKAVIEKLNPCIGVKCRVKVVLNDKNYSAFPAFGSFLERMEVPKEQSNLKMKDSDKTVATSNDAPPPNIAGAASAATPPPPNTGGQTATAAPPPPPPPPPSA